jgi:hypothetical protein
MTLSNGIETKPISLYILKRLQEKAEDFNLILDILAGINGHGRMNSPATLSVPSSKGTSPITIHEAEWREILKKQALEIAEYLVSYGIQDNNVNGWIKTYNEQLKGTGK